ncbi:GNAT family N-acetyltransferase [Lysobacter arvi]|uniref:GNAT family N-acetyltransferase n=1 Tax=Lysobacter arvi TaxID=3038776 RepID=A0ABU1C9V2_9GAMM|nr:GNAT family N-acetyltransferase [Lysobacter arvi]MDR0181969.1 GNAT family N-acetyltransferase [Lysobacter arvi]
MNATNTSAVPETPNRTYPRWIETLRDRTKILIRPITANDRDAEKAFIEGLSDEARHYRFLGQVKSPSDSLLRQVTQLDYVHQVAFAAVVNDHLHERIVGVSRFSTDASGRNCECAVTVTDAWQHKGLGTVLMRHLIAVARSLGIERMVSIDDAQNVQMRELASYLGFSCRADPDDPTQVIHELAIRPEG